MTETGGRRAFVVLAGWVRRCLRTLREDLWTAAPDPLPVSVWLRWLPHGLVFLVAFGVTLGGAAQLANNGQLAAALALAIAVVQGGAVVLALRRPVPGWWLSMAGTVTGAVAVHGKLGTVPAARVAPVLRGPGMMPLETFTWPWSVAGIVAHLLVLLLLALRVRTRVSIETLALTALITYVLEGVWGARVYEPTGFVAVFLSVVAVALGIALRGRREARAELVEQTTLTTEERARRTLLEERSRIARELHDVVAHHMSVISIQAQVAPHLVENPSEELKENLAGIRNNALEALTELRRVLGVLRSESLDDQGTAPDPYDLAAPGTGAAPDAPQPDLSRLAALIENTRAAGLTVTTERYGEPRPYPPGVELSAYRIVQEALSNVLRHAPGASALVEVSHLPSGIFLSVTNSRPRGPVQPSPGSGHGLLGMRERATMLGGHVTTTPTLHGGFTVTAFLPLT
ncbi:sensor histidine kinase [Streptomyces sp. NPDC002520]